MHGWLALIFTKPNIEIVFQRALNWLKPILQCKLSQKVMHYFYFRIIKSISQNPGNFNSLSICFN